MLFQFFSGSANPHEDIPRLDDLFSAVMNMPGFTVDDLVVAVNHLMDNAVISTQGSAYLSMDEEQRVSWLRNFLAKHN
jgi:hypothetical protein